MYVPSKLKLILVSKNNIQLYCTYLFHLINPSSKVHTEVIDIIHEPQRHVLGHSPWSDIGSMHPRPRYSLIEFKHLSVGKREEGREKEEGKQWST